MALWSQRSWALFALFAEIESDIISERTKEGLQAAKAKGKQLGRPRGPGKSKLDKHRDEIIALLKNGSTKTFVARRYGTTAVNLINWLRKNEIKIKPETHLSPFKLLCNTTG